MVDRRKYDNKAAIMVGSVEEFQGQERKVVIISTVRTVDETEYIGNDEVRLSQIGFLRNPKVSTCWLSINDYHRTANHAQFSI